MIYRNDHPLPDVHVPGPGWEVVMNLIGLVIRETIGCDAHGARRNLHVGRGPPKNAVARMEAFPWLS